MKKATQAPTDPFSQYFKAYKELTHSLELSKNAEDIAELTHKVNSILQLHYKAILSFYDKQYRQILESFEENNKRIENLTQKSAIRTQEFLEQSLKQSGQLMQQNIENFKKTFKNEPNAFLEKFIEQANENLNTQVERWNQLYGKQQADMQKDIQIIHEKAKTLLENSEALRKDSLERYKELEKTMNKFLTNKKNNIKPKGRGH